MKMLRGGIIGFGGVGRTLTEEVNKNNKARIVAAYNRGEANRLIARDQFGLKVTDNVQELLDMDIDFVCVVSTNDVHRDHVVASAKAGKAIYCEKPIALNLSEADEMLDAVTKAGVPNMVNYSMRFLPCFEKMKEIVDSGELGRILSVWNHRSRGFGLYEAGAKHPCVMDPAMSGGWTVHHACHGLDMLHWMAGEIEEVYGLTQSTVPHVQSEEIVWASLKFKNGAVGVMGDSTCTLRDESTGIIGTKGSLVVQGEKDHVVMRLKKEGATDEQLIEACGGKIRDASLNYFLDCIQNNKLPKVTIKDARHSLAVALAIQESARMGQPVKVPRVFHSERC